MWNDFITTPAQLIKYVDQFERPTVGAYFDTSNMVRYGVPSADWIRALGKRMLRFDLKGYSKSKLWVGIGEGDEDWPEILKAFPPTVGKRLGEPLGPTPVFKPRKNHHKFPL